MRLKKIQGAILSSNIFILANDAIQKMVIIDLGMNGDHTNFKLKNGLHEFMKNKKYEIEVFLTHCHLDHILGYDNLTEYKDVQYSASPLTAKHINEKDAVTLLPMYGGEIDFTVTKTYQDREKIPFGEIDLEVIHAPGHTDGCAVIFEQKSKSLFSGDVVFARGGCGRVDLPTGNRKVLNDTLSKLAELEPSHLYSGHGPHIAFANVKENILTAKRLLEW